MHKRGVQVVFLGHQFRQVLLWMHYFRTTSVQVRPLQVRSLGIRVFLYKHPRGKKPQPFSDEKRKKREIQHGNQLPGPRNALQESEVWVQRSEPMAVGAACCLCSASLTLVGFAQAALLSAPPAPLLAIFWGLALLGNKENRAIGQCSWWDEF